MDRIKNKIINQQKLTIVCAGDSQVWGQGAEGWRQAMPDFTVGELRRLPDSVPCFVSMLGWLFRKIRGSGKETRMINSGVGSTSTRKYMEYFWNDMVLSYKPDIVVIMSAINDWIENRNVGLNEYRMLLSKMSEDVFAIGGEVVMIVESPVQGAQYSGEHNYEDYIAVSRQVAFANPRIRLADSNQHMKKFLVNGDIQENAKFLFEDRLHVTQIGHFIYLKDVTDALDL